MEDHDLVKNTLDQIPQVNSNATRIVGLVKEGGRITGYQLSDNSLVKKQQAVDMAKQGQTPKLPTFNHKFTGKSPALCCALIWAIKIPPKIDFGYFLGLL